MKHSSAGAAGFFSPAFNMVVVALISLNLCGASVWEGAAALAPRGDLPEEGYYTATNSFPQNTVVDITNLETGRSIRAIVSSGLNTPGLLAVLSPDAAGRIGLGTKTIGRIRMTQPEDPIAFARFTEGLIASGDPDYDPAAMLAVEQNAITAPEEPAPPPARRPTPEEAEAKPLQDSQSPASSSYDPPGALRTPDYADYSQNSIVSVTGTAGTGENPLQRIDDDWEEDWDDLSYSGYFPNDEDSPERSSYLIWEQGGSVGRPEEFPPVRETVVAEPRLAETTVTEPIITEPLAGDPWENAWRDDGNFRIPEESSRLVAEAQSSARSSGNESIAEARITIRQPEPIVQAPVQNGAVEYTLVPAEQRPPAPGPEPEIQGPEVEPFAPPAVSQAQPIDESLFIDSIEETRRAAEEAARLAEERKAAEEAARLAEERRAAEEAARLAEERRAAEEAARLAEERRAAEAALNERPEVTVLLPQKEEEPGGPWVDPMAELLPPPPEKPGVFVQAPEEAGEPQGPWVNPIEPPAKPPAEPAPLELTIITDPPPSPPQQSAPPQPNTEMQGIFSVPVNIITELEKGKYYVQLGAFRSVTSVETALLNIDPAYPLNVQNSGSTGLYRLLIGPVNLGESGALVQRFKGSGYRDAYIRSN